MDTNAPRQRIRAAEGFFVGRSPVKSALGAVITIPPTAPAATPHFQKYFTLIQVHDLTPAGIDIGFSRRCDAQRIASPSESFSSTKLILGRPYPVNTEIRFGEEQFPRKDEGPAASSSSKGQTSRKAGAQSQGPATSVRLLEPHTRCRKPGCRRDVGCRPGTCDAWSGWRRVGISSTPTRG
jgi:hypothetical protein